MRLTTKGRFAVTAMIDLALRSSNGPVALAAISRIWSAKTSRGRSISNAALCPPTRW